MGSEAQGRTRGCKGRALKCACWLCIACSVPGTLSVALILLRLSYKAGLEASKHPWHMPEDDGGPVPVQHPQVYRVVPCYAACSQVPCLFLLLKFALV